MSRHLFLTIFSMTISVLASLVLYNLLTGYKENNKESRYLKIAGKPGQTDEDEADKLENADMVAEGSQFGVQYYDQHKDVE